MSEQIPIPQDVMDKLQNEAKYFLQKHPLLGKSFSYMQGAILGYHLRDKEVKELNETLSIQHSLMVSGEQRGVAKATEDYKNQLQQKDKEVEELNIDVKVLSAIKRGLEKSLFEAFDKIKQEEQDHYYTRCAWDRTTEKLQQKDACTPCSSGTIKISHILIAESFLFISKPHTTKLVIAHQ